MTNLVNSANLLLASTDREVPEWVANSFPIIEIVIASIITLLAIFIIVAVVAQKGESNGVTGVTGQTADTFYNRNKGGSLQGKIKKLITISAILIMVLSITFVILSQIYSII